MARSWSSSIERQQRLGEARQVPLRHHRLVAVGVAPTAVDGAEDGGRVEGVHERARPVVDRLAGDRHVVGVHHAVDEPHEHPLRDQRGLRLDDAAEQRQRGPLVAGRLRGGGARSRGRPDAAAGRGRRWRGRTGSVPTRRWLLATRVSTAPGSTVLALHPASRSPTTASERVVGTPRACMASLTTYSRSIGPTAAWPSPPRENGVRPDPLRCTSRSVPSRRAARRAAAPGRRPAGASSRRTGDRRRPAPPVARRQAAPDRPGTARRRAPAAPPGRDPAPRPAAR